jgi:hypothetical protein
MNNIKNNHHTGSSNVLSTCLVSSLVKNETIDLTMCATPTGAIRERIQAEFTSLMADKYGEHDRVYTDG